MSQADHESIPIGGPPEHSIRHPVPPGEAFISPAAHKPINTGGVTGEGVGAGESNAIDGSEVLFKMYLEMAGEEDKEMAERWRADAKGIILFTGLFSAAVAALLTVSIQDLRQNSTDISASYLAHIFQLLADGDGSRVSIPSSLSLPSSDFSVPKHAVWVNTLWFLSLVISITCALSATFVQQWTHRYVKVTANEELYSPHKQARIRAFFAEGLDKSRLPLVVELIPTFLHLSVFLFFAGLCVFLFNLNATVFDAVVSFVGVCVFTYLCIIIMPILRHDTPYHSPLSSLAWYFWTGMLHAFFAILCLFSLFGFSRRWFIRIPYFSYAFGTRLYHLQGRHRRRYMDGIRKASEESALSLSSEIDGRALVWTVRSLNGDDEQERFFANIPAFCDSKVLAAPRDAFQEADRAKMSDALVRFLHHTLSSNLDPTSKQRRIGICRNAMDAASLSITMPILRRVIYGNWDGLLSSVEFGHFLRTLNPSDLFIEYGSQCVIATIIANVQEHDDRWFELAANHLDKSRDVLEAYLTHGDSVLLANCINICHRTIQGYSDNEWYLLPVHRWKSLETVSKFDAQDTLFGLQNEFCCLWNELIRMTRDSADRSLGIYILRHIRKIYIALHQGTDSAPTAFDASTDNYANVLFFPSSYPLCEMKEHGSCIHEATLGPTGETVHAPSPTSPAVTPPITPVVPSSPALHLSHSTQRLACGTSLGDDAPQLTTQVAASSHPSSEHLEGHQRLATSQNVAARGITQGTNDLPATSSTASSDFDSTPVASTSIPLQVFAPPYSGTVAFPVATDMSPSFPPTTVPSHTPPARSESFSASPPCKFEQTPPPPLTPTAISLVSLQADSNVADAGVPTPIEAPHHPHQAARSGPDIAANVSLGATASPHDVDHPQ